MSRGTDKGHHSLEIFGWGAGLASYQESKSSSVGPPTDHLSQFP